ncbi:hypothetical protein [Dickeya solani]|uniref:Uncharacterized protein n=1 Tax=Dickeya solani TaxID=1089444 RepID=A0AAX4F3D3_9GAMM|nr:hypothetical protein [Dickeya solani]WOA54183.1 hypothetical protein RXA29_08175 [Dickeya solani]
MNEMIYVGGPLKEGTLLSDGYYLGTVANYSISNANSSVERKSLAVLNSLMNFNNFSLMKLMLSRSYSLGEVCASIIGVLGPLLNGHTSLVAIKVENKKPFITSCGWDPACGVKTFLSQQINGIKNVKDPASWRSDNDGLIKLDNLTYALSEVDKFIYDEFKRLQEQLLLNKPIGINPLYSFKPQFNQPGNTKLTSQELMKREVNALLEKDSLQKINATPDDYVANCSRAAHEVLAAFFESRNSGVSNYWKALQQLVQESDNAQSHVFSSQAFLQPTPKL